MEMLPSYPRANHLDLLSPTTQSTPTPAQLLCPLLPRIPHPWLPIFKLFLFSYIFLVFFWLPILDS